MLCLTTASLLLAFKNSNPLSSARTVPLARRQSVRRETSSQGGLYLQHRANASVAASTDFARRRSGILTSSGSSWSVDLQVELRAYGGGRLSREQQRERRALPETTLRFYCAAVGLGELTGYRQAQARTFAPRPRLVQSGISIWFREHLLAQLL